MIQIMETLVRGSLLQVSMTPNEAACFKRVLEFYKNESKSYPSDLGQGGTCADFVKAALDVLEGGE